MLWIMVVLRVRNKLLLVLLVFFSGVLGDWLGFLG